MIQVIYAPAIFAFFVPRDKSKEIGIQTYFYVIFVWIAQCKISLQIDVAQVFIYITSYKEVLYKRNKNKVDSVETGRIVIADLLP